MFESEELDRAELEEESVGLAELERLRGNEEKDFAGAAVVAVWVLAVILFFIWAVAGRLINS